MNNGSEQPALRAVITLSSLRIVRTQPILGLPPSLSLEARRLKSTNQLKIADHAASEIDGRLIGNDPVIAPKSIWPRSSDADFAAESRNLR